MYDSADLEIEVKAPSIRVTIEIAEAVKNDKSVRDQTDAVVREALALLNCVITVREALDLPAPARR